MNVDRGRPDPTFAVASTAAIVAVAAVGYLVLQGWILGAIGLGALLLLAALVVTSQAPRAPRG